ncbi:glycine-rich protein DOT1-like [Rosa chinensis]|uniref:glycine-rich protein DOT1-like n=1 Tax=Rosa chinensis TaxID=74649 RepID=UPI000D097B95|nr:glycine-rich protein DOT1-like [Rosa chinensis]
MNKTQLDKEESGGLRGNLVRGDGEGGNVEWREGESGDEQRTLHHWKCHERKERELVDGEVGRSGQAKRLGEGGDEGEGEGDGGSGGGGGGWEGSGGVGLSKWQI